MPDKVMPDIYKVWLHIERQSVDEEDLTFEDIGESIDLDVDFETLDAAERMRDLLLELSDNMPALNPDFIGNLEGINSFVYNRGDNEHPTPSGEASSEGAGREVGAGEVDEASDGTGSEGPEAEAYSARQCCPEPGHPETEPPEGGPY